jgi:hypothetical protein
MVPSLKVLVESIARDLIEARFAADVATAELAEYYREHPSLRALSIPSLNISNVQVELRFLLEELPEGAGEDFEVSVEERIKEASEALIGVVLRMPTVAERVGTLKLREALVGTLSERLPTVLTPSERVPASHRLAAIEETVIEALRAWDIGPIPDGQMEQLRSEVAVIDAKFAAVSGPAGGPRILVDADSLAKVDPSTVSRVSFTMDLDRKRWVEAEGEDEWRFLLTDE